jgi:DNA replication protein DnaC
MANTERLAAVLARQQNPTRNTTSPNSTAVRSDPYPNLSTAERHPDIPANYLRFPLSSFDQQSQTASWLKDPTWSLYIAGGLGSGKSCLAAAILMEHRLDHHLETINEGYFVIHVRGRFVTPYSFTSVVRSLDAQRHIYEQWRTNRGPLVLDDVGSARDTPHVTEQLLHLLQYRYDHQLKTIITANLSVAQFAKHVDPRVASRLQEGRIMHLGDNDRRRPKA